MLLGKVEIPEQKEKYFMRVTVRQLKGLIREAIDEAHDDMTGYEIDPGDDRGQLHNKGRSSKKMYVLHRPDTYEVFAVFSNEADANEALSIMKKNFIRNVHLDEASFDPSLEMIAKRAKNLAYGGG